ncbi:hypothetical protein GW17_00058964, partial [Ensete ventricosum]
GWRTLATGVALMVGAASGMAAWAVGSKIAAIEAGSIMQEAMLAAVEGEKGDHVRKGGTSRDQYRKWLRREAVVAAINDKGMRMGIEEEEGIVRRSLKERQRGVAATLLVWVEKKVAAATAVVAWAARRDGGCMQTMVDGGGGW